MNRFKRMLRAEAGQVLIVYALMAGFVSLVGYVASQLS